MKTVNFSGTAYTEQSLNTMKNGELVDLYNKIAVKLGKPTTNRFSSLGNGITRTWKLLEQVATDAVGERHPASKPGAPSAKVVSAGPAASLGTPASAKPKPTKKAGDARRGTNLQPPGHAPLPCREGSKQSILVDKLSRQNGATMDELIAALSLGNKPWTEATVRSGFGWDLKQKGYGVRSEFTPSTGTERFYLVLPTIKGELAKIPAHTPLKGKPKADARQTKLPV